MTCRIRGSALSPSMPTAEAIASGFLARPSRTSPRSTCWSVIPASLNHGAPGGPQKELRPAVTVYNSPVLPSEPSSRCPAQPLRAGPSPPTEPVALRQPTPQPFRAGPSDLTIREWGPCGSLVGDLLESFPSLAGFLTGRRGNDSGWP